MTPSRPRSPGAVPGLVGLVLLGSLVSAPSLEGLGWRTSYLPASATAMSLAGGGMALPGDIALTTNNPAHIWGASRETVEYGYLRMFGDLAGHNLRWHGFWRSNPLQLILRSMAEDDLELRGETPTSEPLAYFSARMLSVTLSRGWMLGTTRMGVSTTLAYQRIFDYAARGVWLSAGWQGAVTSWLRWGVTVTNLGLGERLDEERESAGARAGVGLAVKTIWPGGELALDLLVDEHQGLLPSLGWQGAGQVFRLMAGIRWVMGAPLLAGGFQFRYHRWSVSYAYSYQDRTLGQPRMFTLSRRL